MDGPQNANRHISLLALTMLGLGALSVLGGAALAVVGIAGGGALAFSGDVGSGAGVAALMLFSGLAIALTGVPEIACWVGLSKRRPWGRTLAIFLCSMSLAAFPLGTAIGAWGLYVLMSSGGVKAFGIQRTWGSDLAALALGWMFRPDRGSDARSRRRGRRRRSSGGCGLLIVMLLVGAALFTTCGHGFTSCAGALTGDQARYQHVSPMTKARELIDGMSVEPTEPSTPSTPSTPKVPVAPRVDVPVPAPIASKKGIYIYTDKHNTPVIVDDLTKVPDDRKHTLRTP